MDLRYTESDLAFRAELREWLGRTLPELPPPPARDDWPERAPLGHRLAAAALRRRLRGAALAQGVRRARRVADRAADLLEETTRARAPVRRRQLRRHAARGADAHRGGHRRAEGRAPPEDPPRRRGVVPGLLRAGRRLRPRVAAHARRCATATTTSLNGQKIWCSFGQIADFGEFLVRTDPDVAEAPRHLVADPADGPARHRGPAARDGARVVGVLPRCSSPTCGSRSRTASATRTTAGASRTSR